MACKRCGSLDTIKAHLLPQTFTKEVLDVGRQDIVMTDAKARWSGLTKSGYYDPDLLCGQCDAELGKFENAMAIGLRKIRSEIAQYPKDRLCTFEGFSGEDTLKAICGIVWKYCKTGRPEAIEIGPYSDILFDYVFRGEDPGPKVDAFLVKYFSREDEAYFFKAPSPSRYDGVDFVRFSVADFGVFLKTDKRPARLCSLAGLKGKSAIRVWHGDRDQFEDANFAWKNADSRVRRFLRK